MRSLADVDEEALEFFNGLTGELEIELTEPAQQIGNLVNLAAPDTAKLVALRLRIEIFVEHAQDGRPLTER